MNLEVTPVFESIYDSDTRITVLQGGTRSSKTYSMIQYLILECLSRKVKVTVVRKALATIKSTVLEDFLEIMQGMGIYRKENHNKTDNVYNFPNGARLDFLGCDDPQKLRGNKRDILYCNEANELTYEDFFQLLMRTESNIYLDYNPSESRHWIYEQVLNREDCTLLKSTYQDNPFLSTDQVKEIERLRDTDPDYWRIYGLGERGLGRDTVYRATKVEKVPQNASIEAYGLDWGYTNDPTALVAVYREGDNLYIKEMLYATNLTNLDIATRIKELGISDTIYADSAEPKSIEELRRLGIRILPTKKGADSIMAGIDVLKRYKLHYVGDNLEEEFYNYKWTKDRAGHLMNKPIDKYNHALDAARYACYMTLARPNFGKYSIR